MGPLEVRRSWDGALLNGVSDLTTEDWEGPLPHPLSEITVKTEPSRMWALTRHQISQHSHLGFHRFQTCEKYIPVVHKPPSVCYFHTSPGMDPDCGAIRQPRLTSGSLTAASVVKSTS